jgi:putative N6-adenine-specific DNA methylase
LQVSRRPSRARSATPSSDRFECFAAAAPGLESLVVSELNALGIAARVDEGGAAFRGRINDIARANLWLRTASRVVVRVATFRAQAFHELERLGRAITWERYITAGAPVRFRVTTRKSRLYHTSAIEQRLVEAIEHRLGRASVVKAAAGDEGSESTGLDAQLFVVRVVHDIVTVSADTSGDLLHQRGYRQALAKAPMRETLAAAMLLAVGWNGGTPLIDPMCGSGTIPIEAALIARRVAPGLNRSFAFLHWPQLNGAWWAEIRAEARSEMLARSPTRIRGADRDRGAIEAARANAERAGVESDIELSVSPVSALDCETGEFGLVATNPPYGVRVGEAAALRDLYARLGQVLRTRCAAWQLVFLSANPRLDAQLRLPLSELARTRNGGIPVRILRGQVTG